MVTLKNDRLTVQVSPLGAELQSVRSKNVTEFLWNGDPDFWTGHAPLLFPICGGLKDDRYRLGGKEYTLPKHGFARHSEFETESRADGSVCFLLRENVGTLAQYPFRFELRVRYTLAENAVQVEYLVTNRSETEMYFSIGAHEAYACPEGIEAYDVVFPQKETLESYILDGNLLEHNTVPILRDGDTLPLRYDFFKVDALVFKTLKSRSTVLRHRATGRSVRVDFDGFDYFLLWTKPGAPYICLEPWCGVQDPVNADGELSRKEGIRRIAPAETFRRAHTLTFSED